MHCFHFCSLSDSILILPAHVSDRGIGGNGDVSNPFGDSSWYYGVFLAVFLTTYFPETHRTVRLNMSLSSVKHRRLLPSLDRVIALTCATL